MEKPRPGQIIAGCADEVEMEAAEMAAAANRSTSWERAPLAPPTYPLYCFVDECEEGEVAVEKKKKPKGLRRILALAKGKLSRAKALVMAKSEHFGRR
jgi:hypothetical protein